VRVCWLPAHQRLAIVNIFKAKLVLAVVAQLPLYASE
jgi:hypothetical protein